MSIDPEHERLRRWRLVLGKEAEGAGQAESNGGLGAGLSGADVAMDKVLEALYDSDRKGGLGSSSPHVNRWLGDIRQYFPTSVVRVMQRDALERLNLKQMLLQKETLEALEPDVHLVGTLLSLKNVIPAKTKATARQVVRSVVDKFEQKFRPKMVEAVRGAVRRARHTQRPRPSEIDWDRTIRRNLKNYLPEHRSIVPERLVGRGRKRSALQDIVLCIDQSGSMAASVVYASIFGAVLASLKSVHTSLVVFDTEVVDLTEQLSDPVDILFGAQLGGGTDINRAVGYCQSLITRPAQTIFVLVTDLFEGGNGEEMLQRMTQLVSAGVNCICLLALSDRGIPSHDERLAAALGHLGIPTFGCTPDLFPDLMSAAIQRHDLSLWAARHEIVTRGGVRE